MAPKHNDDPNSEEELVLSPSERMGHNMATRVSGGTTEGGRPKSTQKTLASIVLGFELFVVFLAGLTIYGLDLVTPPELGIYGGLGMCLVIIITLGVMRIGKVGIVLGSALHVLYFLAGFILPAIVFVAVIFTALWVYCLVKGAQIDRERAAWIASQG